MNDVVAHVVGALRTGRAEVQRSDRGDHILTDCPRCGKEDHFAIRVVTGWYICFRCGLRGKAELADHIMEWRGAIRRSSTIAVRTAGIAETRDAGGLYESSPGVPLWTGEAGKPSRDYAAKRGLDRETARRYRITADKHGCRMWFPYWEQDGRVSFFMGRTFVDGVEPKTIEPPSSSKPLYGLHVGIAYGREVFPVEGVFDHFATPLSLCLMGSELYDQQVEGLRALGRRVFLLFDPDAKDKAMVKVRRLRLARLEASAVLMEGTSNDPADLGPGLMREIVMSVKQVTAGLVRLPPVFAVHVRKNG